MRVENAGKKMQFICFIIVKLDWIWLDWTMEPAIIRVWYSPKLKSIFQRLSSLFFSRLSRNAVNSKYFWKFVFFRLVEENLFWLLSLLFFMRIIKYLCKDKDFLKKISALKWFIFYFLRLILSLSKRQYFGQYLFE